MIWTLRRRATFRSSLSMTYDSIGMTRKMGQPSYVWGDLELFPSIPREEGKDPKSIESLRTDHALTFGFSSARSSVVSMDCRSREQRPWRTCHALLCTLDICPAHAPIAQRFLGARKPPNRSLPVPVWVFLKVLVWIGIPFKRRWVYRVCSGQIGLSRSPARSHPVASSTSQPLFLSIATWSRVEQSLLISFASRQDFFFSQNQGKSLSISNTCPFLFIISVWGIFLFLRAGKFQAKKKLNRKRDDGMVNRLPRDWRDNGQVVERQTTKLVRWNVPCCRFTRKVTKNRRNVGKWF